MGEFINTKTAQGNYRVQGMEARTQGILARRQAYENAYKLQYDSAQHAFITGDQMMTARQNAASSLAALRTRNGASGITEAGSKLRTEQSTAEILDAAIANMGKSYAISDQNARTQAAQLKREGDTALTLGNIQSDYYNRLASISRNIAPWQLFGASNALLGQSLNLFNFSK